MANAIASLMILCLASVFIAIQAARFLGFVWWVISSNSNAITDWKQRDARRMLERREAMGYKVDWSGFRCRNEAERRRSLGYEK